jgi:hypothetical protein
MCLTCIEVSLLSKGLALFYSEPVPRLAFFYIVNSSVEEGKAEAAKREPDRAKHQYKPRLGW